VCVRFFPRITVAAADCIVRQPVVLDFCVLMCVCTSRLAFIVYSVGLYFLRYLLLFFRLVLSAGQLKRVLNEPIRIPHNIILLPVYYCNYSGPGKRIA
jgi:hypothetical protein